MEASKIEVNEPNRWRLDTPGAEAGPELRGPRTGQVFMVSADGHVNEPANLFYDRIPTLQEPPAAGGNRREGRQVEGLRGVSPDQLRESMFEGEDAGCATRRAARPEERLADLAADGVDAEILFPNKGLTMWATPDAEFARPCAASTTTGPGRSSARYNDRLSPMACVATADIDGSIAEIQRCAKLGFRGLCLALQARLGPATITTHLNYNLPEFDPLWACIQDVDLPITFHVSTGRDPRASRGNGGAVINYAVTLALAHHRAARQPLRVRRAPAASRLRVRHHRSRHRLGALGARGHGRGLPQAPHVGAAEARRGCRASTSAATVSRPSRKITAGLAWPEHGDLVDNFMWANDYPHHEGTWPHSAEAIERTMKALEPESREKILGGNAARLFGFRPHTAG